MDLGAPIVLVIMLCKQLYFFLALARWKVDMFIFVTLTNVPSYY